MSRTLYVTDMDGTLLNNGSFVSARSSEIISDLSARGALITVATARTPATVVPLMDGTLTTVPYIVMTGAAMYDPRHYHYLNHTIIPKENCPVLADIFRADGIHPFVYHFVADETLLVSHTQEMTQPERNFYLERSHLRHKRFTFEPLPNPFDNVALCFAIGDREPICRAAEQIEATGLFSVSCYPDIFSQGIQLLEVFDVGVSKARAVARLARMLEVDRIVAFGDNLNDLPMLSIADVAVAVANANPAVKAAADHVIGPNFDDSVARFIADDFDNHLI